MPTQINLPPGASLQASTGELNYNSPMSDLESDHTPRPRTSDIEDEGDEGGSVSECPKILKTIWESRKWERTTDSNGRKVMKCLHCYKEWKGHYSHTKAVGHVLGGMKDVRMCTKVSPSWRQCYRTLKTTAAKKKDD